MSHLLKEDDDFLYLYKYIHNNEDELPDWFIDKEGNYKYPVEIAYADEGVGYEVKVTYRINKHTYKVITDEITP